MKRWPLHAVPLLLVTTLAKAQTVPAATAPAHAPEESAWAFSLSAYTYFIPDDHEYIQPTITADHDWLHLEARYNYEDQNTASTWIGCNFSGGSEDKIAWEVTPMLGGVFRDTTGIAPGYKGSVSWWKLELY